MFTHNHRKDENFLWLDERKLLKYPQILVKTPSKEAVINSAEWLRTGKIMLKEFKIKGHPMKLIGNQLNEINPTHPKSGLLF